MADFQVDFPSDFLTDLLNTDSDEIIKEALIEAAPIMEAEMKDILKKDGHDLSGEMIDSIKAIAPRKSENGAWIVNVIPTGYSNHNYSRKGSGNSIRKYKVSNALKMIWIEYGVAGRQAANPFLTRVVNNVRNSAMKKMQEIYNKRTGAK